ncbi:MAG: penicillin-binding transpeptidase domain-containing protein [Lachnospiraceae bacterium]|nr:penicillin-binding transpeptidase domain-containing protein [Lachnospiraceae bacterium]
MSNSSQKRSGRYGSVGSELDRILDGPSEAELEKRGPELFPGLEDRGIGAVRETEEPEEEPEEADSDAPGEAEEDETPEERAGRGGRPADDPERGEHAEKPVRRRSKGPYRFISGAFILLFVLLIGHLVYFNINVKDDYVNSTYNKNRRTKIARTISRGSILSSDGKVLAYSETDSENNETRVYPYANVFDHVVGYVTSHDTSGIESYASGSLLTSHSNIIDQVINDILGRKNKGDTVVSTLDSGLQEKCYSTLGDYNGAVIVLEPKTGAIRAMVSKPGFDPNTLEENWAAVSEDTASARLWNRATQGLYAPGSTFKIITSLAYYRANRTLDKFSFNCTGQLQVGEYNAHCFEYAEHGEEDFRAAFANSCNTAFSEIGLELGADRLTGAAQSLLFDTSLPCDIHAGRARWNLESGASQEELVMTAFGQGKTQVTPYYMALLVSAIANDGVLMKPYLVDHVESTAGTSISKNSARAYRTVMTKDEADLLTDLMKAVVAQGSASKLSGKSYQAAGKTGSAEYYKGDGSIGTNSWFVGFTNPDDPDLAIVVLAENGGAGSSTAVPMAASILDYYYSR